MAWHWAQTLDQQQAEESNTGGFRHRHWRHHTSKAAPPQPQRQSGPRYRGRSSRQLLAPEERVRAFTRLWPEPERGGGVAAAAGWIGWVTFAAGVLSNLCRATATTALQLEATGPAKPTIRTFRRTFPACPAEEQLCNAELCNSFAKLLWHKKYTSSGRDQSYCQGKGEGARWLARIVGKQVRSWSNWHGLHQLGGWTRQRLLLQAKSKKEAQQTCAAFWIQTVAI